MLRKVFLALIISGLFRGDEGFAHGPQIQLTIDDSKLVTRTLLVDASYSTRLTAPKSVYVIPLLESQLGDDSIWYARPNAMINPITLQSNYTSGPGFAYGYDLVDGGPQAFEEGSILSMQFTGGLRLWNGAAFEDAGNTQLKAFRGSNVNIDSPAENFAVTSDSAPFDAVSLAPVAAAYGSEGTEIHGTIRYALLGDGVSPASPSPDGVYLLSMNVSSTQIGLAPSDEYFFVLHKNAATETILDAVSSLDVPAALVQHVPEPGSMGLAATIFAMTWLFTGRSRAARGRSC